MSVLRSRHPDSDFGPLMRPYTVDAASNTVQKAAVEAGDPAPAGVKFQYLPKRLSFEIIRWRRSQSALNKLCWYHEPVATCYQCTIPMQTYL